MKKRFRIIKDRDGFGIKRRFLFFFWVEEETGINEGGGSTFYRYDTEDKAFDRLMLIIGKESLDHTKSIVIREYDITVNDGQWRAVDRLNHSETCSGELKPRF